MYTHSISKSRHRAQDRFTKKALALGVSLALSTAIAHASQTAQVCTAITNTNNNNFTMLNGSGGIVGGTNDVSFTWDGTKFNNSNDYTGPAGSGNSTVSNATISSPTLFNGHGWIAHDVQVFAPGTYTFDTALGGGNGESGLKTVTVGSDQFGMHMLFDWNGNNNIDVFVVQNKNATFGSGNGSNTSSGGQSLSCYTTGSLAINNANCLWTGGLIFGGSGNRPAGNHVWMLASSDPTSPSDTIPGVPMATGGPFAGFNANFNFNGTLSKLSGLEDGTCALASDQQPDPFSFNNNVTITNAAFSTSYPMDAIFAPPGGSPSPQLSGLGVSPPGTGITSPISISGTGNPQYSLDGGTTWFSSTDPARTVQNGSLIKVRVSTGIDKGVTVTATLNIGNITGSFSVSTPAAPVQVFNNFTMIDSDGKISGGANDVKVSGWTFSSTNNNTSFGTTFGMTLTSNTAFDGYFWKAHDIRVFDPGNYTFNTACTIAELHATGGQTCANPGDAAHKPLPMTVKTGQLGAHMLFDWGSAASTSCGLANCDIDVAIVWDRNKKFGPSDMSTIQGGCKDTIWELSSTDPDGDGKSGIPMTDGPFTNFNANFNLQVTQSGPFPGCSNTPPSMTVPDTGVSKGAGCSLSATPVNPLERGDWWLLMGFVAWLGLVVKRKRAK